MEVAKHVTMVSTQQPLQQMTSSNRNGSRFYGAISLTFFHDWHNRSHEISPKAAIALVTIDLWVKKMRKCNEKDKKAMKRATKQ